MHTPALYFLFLSLFVAYIAFSHSIYDHHVIGARVYLVYALVAAIIDGDPVTACVPHYALLCMAGHAGRNEVGLITIPDDGTEYRVPSNHFLAASVDLAQNRSGRPNEGSFPTETQGATRNSRVAKGGKAAIPMV